MFVQLFTKDGSRAFTPLGNELWWWDDRLPQKTRFVTADQLKKASMEREVTMKGKKKGKGKKKC